MKISSLTIVISKTFVVIRTIIVLIKNNNKIETKMKKKKNK